MKTSEWSSLLLFLTATMLSFLRPLYAEMMPGMKPAYVFLILSLLTFLVEGDEGKCERSSKTYQKWPQSVPLF